MACYFILMVAGLRPAEREGGSGRESSKERGCEGGAVCTAGAGRSFAILCVMDVRVLCQ